MHRAVMLDFIRGCENQDFSHPLITRLPAYPISAMGKAIKLRSLHPKPITIQFDDGEDAWYMGELRPGQETTIAAYTNTSFFFTEKQAPQRRVGLGLTVNDEEVSTYIARTQSRQLSP